MVSGSQHGHGPVSATANLEAGIREVWASNLEQEMKGIRRVLLSYPMVAMDTEFPGVVARPIGEFKSTTDYQYQLLRCNVGLLKLIQVGLTFMNDQGELAPDIATWQFNFKFSLGGDMFAQDSIELLKSSGLQFERHEHDGIDPTLFAEVIMTSGLVLNEDVTWLSFHSGYDFGYLLKLLTNTSLPNDEGEFFELLRIYFPKVYDVKYLMKSCRYLKGGLQEVADQLEVRRIGPQHQAGSDSLLTGLTFFRMKEMFFEDNMDESRYCGYLYGLGLSYTNGDGGGGGGAVSAYESEHGGRQVIAGEGDSAEGSKGKSTAVSSTTGSSSGAKSSSTGAAGESSSTGGVDSSGSGAAAKNNSDANSSSEKEAATKISGTASSTTGTESSITSSSKDGKGNTTTTVTTSAAEEVVAKLKESLTGSGGGTTSSSVTSDGGSSTTGGSGSGGSSPPVGEEAGGGEPGAKDDAAKSGRNSTASAEDDAAD